MKRIFLFLLTLFMASSAFAGDFITRFLKECVEPERPVSNVNIGKAMLDKMAANTSDEELKATFRELKSIRIITTENRSDSRHYYDKAKEMAAAEFSDFEELASINEKGSQINILLRKSDEKMQDLILIALDNESKLTIITVSGNIDLNSISKLSDSLQEKRAEEPLLNKDNDREN
ncbi:MULTISPECIES: DUF4252 domain-containing protein [Petrimonas]|jgi:hypothetical protein|uniref:DUF4252 domain-containing protein n=1 Tax=Petrimonas mucosa TaxID=1642646 RepID=A0A1G4G9J1_9BACT|nr:MULTISPECIES: DUF4252 domain-containing protein [Petrimonas]MDD3560015.1 DUF4252 domain-containing protein [Petrimonas mucosa]SCM59182.1 hypothetical protein ING2E5A_2380 [Petrimonas mucosa]HHT30440.1 DUF4252 domain-containing protein [Petrimonas mucosa]